MIKTRQISFDSAIWIIARLFGLDGTSLQGIEDIRLLKKRFGLSTDVITGEDQRKRFGNAYDVPAIRSIETFDKLSLAAGEPLYQASFPENIQQGLAALPAADAGDFTTEYAQQLAAGDFTGSDTSSQYTVSGWKGQCTTNANTVSSTLDDMISTNHNAPIFVHNLIALRHRNPSAALGIEKLIRNNPNRVFINISPDPLYERPHEAGMLADHVKEKIATNIPGEGKNFFAGPYKHDNLFHIVSNKKQKRDFQTTYGLSDEQVYVIPDFVTMTKRKALKKTLPDKNFYDYLSRNCLTDGETLDKETVYFLTNVRPVARKKLRTTLFLIDQYKKQNPDKKVAMVITHPNGDDLAYFNETVDLARELEIPLVYLGSNIKRSRDDSSSDYSLTDIYHNLAVLNSISVILSDKGGFENGILEALKEKIPVIMNRALNSYGHLTDAGIDVLGLGLDRCHEVVDNNTGQQISGMGKRRFNAVKYFNGFVNTYGFRGSQERKERVNKHYDLTYQNFSDKAVIPEFKRLLTNAMRYMVTHQTS